MIIFEDLFYEHVHTHNTIGSKLAEWGGNLDGRLLA